MKFIVVSDLHLRIRNPENRIDDVVNETQWEKLHQIFSFARKEKCPIIQTGDFCDIPRSWYLLPTLTSFLKEYKDVTVYCVYGQHDTYYYSEELRSATILGELEKVGYITILGSKPVRLCNNSIHLYGCSYSDDLPRIVDKSKINILSIHAPISTKPIFLYHKYINAKEFLRTTSFDFILCGDIHRKFKVRLGNRYILNTGPILRSELTEYNLNHHPCLFLVNSKKPAIKTKYLTIKDSALVFKKPDKIKQESKEIETQLFEKLKQNNIQLKSLSFKENLLKIVKAMKFNSYEKSILDKILNDREEE